MVEKRKYEITLERRESYNERTRRICNSRVYLKNKVVPIDCVGVLNKIEKVVDEENFTGKPFSGQIKSFYAQTFTTIPLILISKSYKFAYYSLYYRTGCVVENIKKDIWFKSKIKEVGFKIFGDQFEIMWNEFLTK